MIEEILSGLYRVEIPLPGSPLKSINSYMLKDSGRSLIIDTGWNLAVCRQAVNEAVSKLNINLDRTDFFITHIHGDHIGMVGVLARDGAKVYFNRREAMDFRVPLEWMDSATAFAAANGFPADELRRIKSSFQNMEDAQVERPPFTFVQEGDVINAGRYSFRCVETPGHSRGHTCLYAPAEKLFICGDHVLGDITPNIGTRHNDEMDPLKEYIDSLDKVSKLDVRLALPGHRSVIHNIYQRIDELKQHHKVRIAEVQAILRNGPQDAYRVAAQMTWDMAGTWADFAPISHWFAFGEALSHLRYLLGTGQAVRRVEAGLAVYLAA